MIVYRVENSDGVGPYYCNSGEWCDGPHTQDTGRPMPYEDIPNSNHDCKNRFGFESMDKLMQWFSTSEMNKLYERGFRIVTFEVSREHTLIGAKQLIFIRQYATQVSDVCPMAELTSAPVAA